MPGSWKGETLWRRKISAAQSRESFCETLNHKMDYEEFAICKRFWERPGRCFSSGNHWQKRQKLHPNKHKRAQKASKRKSKKNYLLWVLKGPHVGNDDDDTKIKMGSTGAECWDQRSRRSEQGWRRRWRWRRWHFFV